MPRLLSWLGELRERKHPNHLARSLGDHLGSLHVSRNVPDNDTCTLLFRSPFVFIFSFSLSGLLYPLPKLSNGGCLQRNACSRAVYSPSTSLAPYTRYSCDQP